MTKPTIVAVVGLIGSGKTEATQKFMERGFVRVGFNDRVYEEVDRRRLERTEINERAIREEMRKNSGMAVMAMQSIPLVEEALRRGKNVVVESLYSWSEYKLMKERFGDQFKVLTIYAPPRLRYERLVKREVRPLSFEEARSRDRAEIENIEKAGPIAMADWILQNTGTREEFLIAVDDMIDKILHDEIAERKPLW